MEINLYQTKAALVVETYGPEGFRVSGTSYDTAIMLTAEACQPWLEGDGLGVGAFLQAKEFLAGCEVILVGTGKRAAFIPPSQRAALRQDGLNLEVMDTGAACRTYSVLLGDGRKVGALLLPDK